MEDFPMGEDFKTKLNSLLSGHRAANQKTQDSLRKLQKMEEQARKEFKCLRQDVFHPVMLEAAELLESHGYHAEVQETDPSHRVSVEPAITLFITASSIRATITYRAGTPARTVVINGRTDEITGMFVDLPTTRDELQQQLVNVLEQIFPNR
jgi:response regulator of citrate/malate metabolism